MGHAFVHSFIQHPWNTGERLLNQVIVLVLGYIRQMQVLFSKPHVQLITIYRVFPDAVQLPPSSLAHLSQPDTASTASTMTLPYNDPSLQRPFPNGCRMVEIPMDWSNDHSGKNKPPLFCPTPTTILFSELKGNGEMRFARRPLDKLFLHTPSCILMERKWVW